MVFTNVFTPATDGFTEDTKLYNDNAYKVDMGIESNQTETNGEFALTFRSTLNEEFTTQTLNVYNMTEWDLEEAINALPNKVCVCVVLGSVGEGNVPFNNLCSLVLFLFVCSSC